MITDNYIKMCEQSEEIQKAWKPKKGDYYAVIVHGKPTDIIDIYIDGFPLLPQKFIPLSALYIWLPTLEQLFEMVDITKYGRLEITEFKNGYCVSQNDFYVSEISKSIHECFLEMVMITKYHKIWTGEKWEAM